MKEEEYKMEIRDGASYVIVPNPTQKKPLGLDFTDELDQMKSALQFDVCTGHMIGDDVLIQVIRKLDHEKKYTKILEEIIKVFTDMEKWYE